MRLLYRPILAACSAAILLGACSDESTPLPSLKTATYSGKTLAVNYCGEAMPAKVATFTPSADGKTATLEMSGVLDLSSLGISGVPQLPAPGVLPGSPTVSIPLTLTPTDKGVYTFTGSGETPHVTYNYSGELGEELLTVNLTDVKLKVGAMAGKVFKPRTLKATLADLRNPKDIESPFYIDWEIGTIPGLELDPGKLLTALTLAPIIPVYNGTAYSSIAQVFDQSVQTLAMLDNGNIPVRYYSSKEGATQLLTTSGNMLQYVVTGANSIQLYVNPLSAIGMWLVAQSTPTWLPSFFDTAYADSIKQEIANSKPVTTPDEADTAIRDALVQALILAIQPALRDGVPLEFAATADGGVNLYLNTATCTRFISLLLTDLMKQPAVMARLGVLLAEAGLTEAQVANLLQGLPAVLQATTRLNIGLSLTPISGAN